MYLHKYPTEGLGALIHAGHPWHGTICPPCRGEMGTYWVLVVLTWMLCFWLVNSELQIPDVWFIAW